MCSMVRSNFAPKKPLGPGSDAYEILLYIFVIHFKIIRSLSRKEIINKNCLCKLVNDFIIVTCVSQTITKTCILI